MLVFEKAAGSDYSDPKQINKTPRYTISEEF